MTGGEGSTRGPKDNRKMGRSQRWPQAQLLPSFPSEMGRGNVSGGSCVTQW